MKTKGIHIWRFGLYVFIQSLLRYRQFYLLPTLMIEYVKGKDIYIDVEFKLLCFSFGVRLIWITKRFY